MIQIFDYEVFSYDWIFVAKDIETGDYTVVHNDNDAVAAFMETEPILGGFNNKHYDQFIHKAVLMGASPEEIKQLNDFIIVEEGNGWEYPLIRESRVFFEQFDLMDDCQQGLSLKAIEAHLGMDIRETTVSFDIKRPLTKMELQKVIFYCKHDVDATERLYNLRKNYLANKVFLGRAKGISDSRAMYMTNAKLTAAYLDAQPPKTPWTDEREYQYPSNLLREYIQQEVFHFFDRMRDKTLSDEEVFTAKLNIFVGDCPVTIAFGGIHGALPTYREKATSKRSIRNRDVMSYYPFEMVLDGYCSRNIPDSKRYADMLQQRIAAKKSGDKAKANALKLVANTTYGGMLNRYNDLYDPLMARSVCITGQLRLLELASHLVADCPTLKIIQLNTDGVMVSLDNDDLDTYNAICQEWQDRTGFELEEDCISEIVQKDVNNYVEIGTDGNTKIKGGMLVRGIAPAGAFNINNNATIVAKALLDYFSNGTPVEDTINGCTDILAFQLIAKASSKYSGAFHIVCGNRIPVQKCNRVYAAKNKRYGTIIKVHGEKCNDVKIGGLPDHCIIDNTNTLSMDSIDRDWYIRLARSQVNDFLGIKPPKRNTRRINSLIKKLNKILEDM